MEPVLITKKVLCGAKGYGRSTQVFSTVLVLPLAWACAQAHRLPWCPQSRGLSQQYNANANAEMKLGFERWWQNLPPHSKSGVCSSFNAKPKQKKTSFIDFSKNACRLFCRCTEGNK